MVTAMQNCAPTGMRELLDMRVALPFFQTTVPSCPACTPASTSASMRSSSTSSSSTARAGGSSHRCVMCGGRGVVGSCLQADSWSMRIDPCLSCGSYLCAACRQVWHVQRLTQAKTSHPQVAIDSRVAEFTSRLQLTEVEISRKQAELASLEHAAQQAALRASMDATTLEEEAAVRAAAFAAEVCEAAAEADAVTATGAMAQAVKAAGAIRCTQLRAEADKQKKQEALSLAYDERAIEEARARLQTVLENIQRPDIIPPRVIVPVVEEEASSGPVRFWDRLTGVKQHEQHGGSLREGSRSSENLQGLGSTSRHRRLLTGHTRLRREVEDAHKSFNEQLFIVNQVHDDLGTLVAEAGNLRGESDQLRSNIRSEAVRIAELKAEIMGARTQVEKRRKDIQDKLEAEFRTFHELVMTALGELPPFDGDLEKRDGVLDKFAKRLFAIERHLGLQQQNDGNLEQVARELFTQFGPLASAEEDQTKADEETQQIPSDPSMYTHVRLPARPEPDVAMAQQSMAEANPLRAFITSAVEEDRCARPIS